MKLLNKVAVVTGASSGIGLHFSEALSKKRTHVFGLARNLNRLIEIRAQLGNRFHPIECDISKEENVRVAFDLILSQAGRIDILINNAGLGKFGPVDQLPLDEWDIQMNTNLRGVFLCTKAALPQMKKQNKKSGFGGHIINIASVAGLVGNPNLSAYNTTKFGLRGFSEALMKEVREDGIKVTCLYPGSIATRFADVANTQGSPNPMQPEDVAGTVIHVLETPDNYLISEVMMRPLRPRG